MKKEKQDLQRGLKNRHVQLISIGGAIGTGLFLGSGKSIQLAGPSILLAYAIMGGVCFLIMRALGELLYLILATIHLLILSLNISGLRQLLSLAGHIGFAGLRLLWLT